MDIDMDPKLLFAIDSPKYQNIRFDDVNTFSGFVLDCTPKRVKEIRILADGSFIERVPVDLPSDDLYPYVPHLESAKNCRFRFDLLVSSAIDEYLLRPIYEDGTSGEDIVYQVAEAKRLMSWFEDMNERLREIEQPPADLVYLTQGIHDVAAYKDSIIPGIYNMTTYLRMSGIETNKLRAILDIGCGTGRMLIGWHLENPDRTLYGCDINATLIDWSKNNLPKGISFCQNQVLPPLPYDDGTFDFVYLLSVFTHLSLETQKRWIEELGRILKKNGVVLITFHGDSYVYFTRPNEIKRFKDHGYMEPRNEKEGPNAFLTFHRFGFVKQLFNAFLLKGYFPQGNKVLFPIAAFQDVYVLQKTLG
jgi:SAM-dependent methyltransferase